MPHCCESLPVVCLSYWSAVSNLSVVPTDCCSVQFSKLAKIEIGGTKGKTLTTSVHQVHQDFQTAVQRFQSVKCVCRRFVQ